MQNVMQGVPRQDLCGLLFKELWSEDEVGSMSMGSITLAIRVYKYIYTVKNRHSELL